MRHSIALPVVETSQVGDARRAAARLAAEIGLPDQEHAAVGLIVTELANNLVKNATDGQIVLRVLGNPPHRGIEILSLDSGPGIADVWKCVADGFSTSGTPGNGLGAVKRLSRDFDIYSAIGVGTIVLSRVFPASFIKASAESRIEIGAICVPFPGEGVCGDSWAFHEGNGRAALMVVDGLGHGPVAAEAADEAIRAFTASCTRPAVEIVEAAHASLRSTRGAVMAVAEVRIGDGAVSYCGVGNISGAVAGADTLVHMVSLSGTVGYAAKPRTFDYNWPRESLLILSSDGLINRWQFSEFPGLLSRQPSIVAGALYQHYSRVKDDVTVLVARWTRD